MWYQWRMGSIANTAQTDTVHPRLQPGIPARACTALPRTPLPQIASRLAEDAPAWRAMDRAMISAAFAARASATGAPISFRHFVRQKRLILERIPFAIVLRYS